MSDKTIYVTQPSLPPLEDFVESLKQIWDSKILTNNGPFHQEFEKQLAEYLGVKYISVFSNGTLALMTALQCLGIKGEVITTPYTFVATANSLYWNGITPVFCDIDPVYGNIDADKLEALITPNTTAIMPVHVYGNPCDVEKIERLAAKHGLKVIYDAAHAFGVTRQGESVLNFGDLSILSFHATKAFNTIEGGAIISHDEKTKERIDNLKNFGITDEVTVVEPGINAKMNELQCAFGLLQLREMKTNIAKRKALTEFYRQALSGIKGLRFLEDMENVEHNYSYFPVFVDERYPISRDALYEELKSNNIYTRRYFYPLVSSFSPYKELASSAGAKLPQAVKVSDQVLCLPIYSEMDMGTALRIVELIKHREHVKR
jgi:dTDP-4-amino-4,6-dideoxygalactose transaminase